MAQLKDPVDRAAEGQQTAKDEELKKTFDISNLKVSDFKAAMMRDARVKHPFDGYPEKKVQIGTYRDKGKEVPLIVNLTHLVLFRDQVKQDPSGERVSLGFPELRDKEGKVIRPNTEKMGTIRTAHNRRVKDYETGGVDIDVVFDRTVQLADGTLDQVAVVPSPSCRAQLAFRYDSKAERIREDARYLFADTEQMPRLNRIFQMIINPRIRLEESIRKNFDESGDSFKSSSLPGIPEGE